MKLIIFALIPLILSIGISPVIPFSDAVESNQICIDKVWIENSKGKIACVTSSTADKLVQRGWGIMLSDDIVDESMEIKSLEIPSYPDQPEVHPNLIAGYDYSSPPAVHQVTDNVYVAVGYDLANSIMIEGDDGIIIVDTLSTYEDAKEVITEFRKITDKPVKAIIYTHGHLDHVHGTGAFLEEGEDIEIYAHESHVDFYINENSVLGPIAAVRSGHASGAFLPSEGEDRFNLGVLAPMEPGTISYAFPTQTFSDELEVEISGVKMKMVFVAGESSDQIYIWLPDQEVLLIGDNIYAIIPNVYTLRGSVYRDPMNYVNALDKMIPLDA
jgi:alkyl sulfatase BDS1-like metallo-beta-lactamase superfamily hydrolase